MENFCIANKISNCEIECDAKKEGIFTYYKCKKINNKTVKLKEKLLQIYNINDNEISDFETRKKYFMHSNFKRIMNEYKSIDKISMTEKRLAKELWNISYNLLKQYDFDIIDIQLPLKSKREQNFGEIDLIGVNVEENNIQVLLIEMKPIGTDEQLIRALSEITAYKYLLSNDRTKEILRRDFIDYINQYNGKGKYIEEIKNIINNSNIKFVPALLLPKELYENDKELYAKIKEENNIKLYSIKYTKDNIKYEKDKMLFCKGEYPEINKV